MPPDAPSASVDLAGQLDRSLDALALPLPPEARRQLLDYVGLMRKWNRVYNLTAIRDPQQMLVQHVLDSLAIVAPLRETLADRRQPPLVVDVGSGAGLPGIPLAIAWPALHVTMIEPVGKKTAFIQQAIGALRLSTRASVAQCRVEQLPQSPLMRQLVRGEPHPLAQRPPDLIVSRAFASLADFVAAVDALAGPATRVAAMKGAWPGGEIDDLPSGWSVDATLPLTVPGLDARRHLILLSRSA
ncbi:MAG: 16S rRNA (guanine(527)-N(7))-methyltransferase RsmG [Burkholderiaceae bacterium]